MAAVARPVSEPSSLRDFAGALPSWLTEAAERGVQPLRLPELVRAGSRNQTLTKLAGALRRLGYSAEEVRRDLHAFNTSGRLETPLSRDEVDRIAGSAANWEAGQLAAARSTWWPQDIDAVLSGDLTALEPTVWEREDGVRLLYPGRVHDFHGEPETLKSWAAQVAAASVLAAGAGVLYVDFENEARDVVSHLISLGVSAAQVRSGLLYVRPEEKIEDAAVDELVASLADRAVSLTVIDGVNNSLAASGYDPNSNAEVRRWWDRLVRRLQLATDGPVVLIDHVVKNKDQRGRWAVGAGQKLAGIDGASFGFELAQPFGRGRTGVARVLLEKDRPGALRGQQGIGKEIAKLRLTSEPDGSVTAELLKPTDAGDADGELSWQPTAYMDRVSRLLEKADAPMSQRAITTAVGGKAAYARQALAALIAGDYVTVTMGQRNAVLHRSVRPFRDVEDQPPPGAPAI